VGYAQRRQVLGSGPLAAQTAADADEIEQFNGTHQTEAQAQAEQSAHGS